MKAIFTILAAMLVLNVFGQEKAEEKETNLRICGSESELVYIDGIKHRTLECYTFYSIESSRVIQPTAVNELPNGTMPLSEELPYVHTIRGAVYTYDHIRYTVRN